MTESIRTIFWALSFIIIFISFGCSKTSDARKYAFLPVIGGSGGEFKEVYSIAGRNGEFFISDGEAGKIFRILKSGEVKEFSSGLDTPSGIAFLPDGRLIAAETGRNRIVAITADGITEPIAGNSEPGFLDGEALQAQFRAPTDVAVAGSKIFVSDTYNDAIRVIESGKVKTLAGHERGFKDGQANEARFDTPLGIATFGDGNLLVADFGNRRLRLIEDGQIVSTLAGNGGYESVDGSLISASFSAPTDVAVSDDGVIFVSDAGSLRIIGKRVFSFVETLKNINGENLLQRASGLALAKNGDLLVADRENRIALSLSSVRPLSAGNVPSDISADQFRSLQPGRWPFDPPESPRDIAGTLGEIRGEITGADNEAWFHNALDIAGGYGETARFVRNEKVLDPAAAANFGTLREMLRMPTLGYVHIRLGRFADGRAFDDKRFLFSRDSSGKIIDVRIPRGTSFAAGDAIGTLNEMNHVHLIAGRPGNVMNGLEALDLPGRRDTIPPVIEKVQIFTANGKEIETDKLPLRINRSERLKIVVTAFDKMDGNHEKRRLGVYELGYSLSRADNNDDTGELITIRFDRIPPHNAINLVYDIGSRSGATGPTLFRYIVTNLALSGEYREDYLNLATLQPGQYLLKVSVADFDKNRTIRKIPIEVTGN